MTFFFFFRSAGFVEIFCFGGGNSPLEFLLFNPTKIWGASPPLVTHQEKGVTISPEKRSITTHNNDRFDYRYTHEMDEN
jgi:hypothetical protein